MSYPNKQTDVSSTFPGPTRHRLSWQREGRSWWAPSPSGRSRRRKSTPWPGEIPHKSELQPNNCHDDHSGTRGWRWGTELTRTTTRATSLKRRRWDNLYFLVKWKTYQNFARLSSWSRRRKQSSKIRKKIQDETKHPFGRLINRFVWSLAIRCSPVWWSFDQNLSWRTSAFGSPIGQSLSSLQNLTFFWWFSLVNWHLPGKQTGSKLENVCGGDFRFKHSLFIHSFNGRSLWPSAWLLKQKYVLHC